MTHRTRRRLVVFGCYAAVAALLIAAVATIIARGSLALGLLLAILAAIAARVLILGVAMRHHDPPADGS